MKIRLHDVVHELEKESFRLSVKTERGGVLLVVTTPGAAGAGDYVASLNLHNNLVGVYEEDVFWTKVGLYQDAHKHKVEA
jgi:hypothetical protein